MVLSGQWNVSLCSCPADAGRAPSRCRNFPAAAAAVCADSAGPGNGAETRGAPASALCSCAPAVNGGAKALSGAGPAALVLQACRRSGGAVWGLIRRRRIARRGHRVKADASCRVNHEQICGATLRRHCRGGRADPAGSRVAPASRRCGGWMGESTRGVLPSRPPAGLVGSAPGRPAGGCPGPGDPPTSRPVPARVLAGGTRPHG